MYQRIFAFLMCLNFQDILADTKAVIADFAVNGLSGWTQKSFKGETNYTLQSLENSVVLKADSQAAASGLFKEQTVDLRQTPFLNWRWQAGSCLLALNEQSKVGDDYVARIYVLVKGGLAFWQTKAINYVWSSNAIKDSVWPNAFAGKQVMMLALRGPEAPLNTWQQEKRNVRADFKQLFAEDVVEIDAVAIMTDTDNSAGTASAIYGDIWFSKD